MKRVRSMADIYIVCKYRLALISPDRIILPYTQVIKLTLWDIENIIIPNNWRYGDARVPLEDRRSVLRFHQSFQDNKKVTNKNKRVLTYSSKLNNSCF